MKKANTVPLERAISKLGLHSRKVARELILAGKVQVDGRLVKDPDYKVVPEKIKLIIDEVEAKKVATLYLILHKPKGLVTTSQDEKGRKTIYSCLEDIKQHLPAVGRLDMMTSGLLILTNDNRFSAWLTDPLNAIPRNYIVAVRGEVTEEEIHKMIMGIKDQGETLKANNVVLLKSSGKESLLNVELCEGKNREIRRLMLAFKHEVTALKRISFGRLELGQLEIGQWRELSKTELEKSFPDYPFQFLNDITSKTIDSGR
ncbi:MAG: pseudouridine synthase [Bdellovibrio sp.]